MVIPHFDGLWWVDSPVLLVKPCQTIIFAWPSHHFHSIRPPFSLVTPPFSPLNPQRLTSTARIWEASDTCRMARHSERGSWILRMIFRKPTASNTTGDHLPGHGKPRGWWKQWGYYTLTMFWVIMNVLLCIPTASKTHFFWLPQKTCSLKITLFFKAFGYRKWRVNYGKLWVNHGQITGRNWENLAFPKIPGFLKSWKKQVLRFQSQKSGLRVIGTPHGMFSVHSGANNSIELYSTWSILLSHMALGLAILL